MRKTLTLLLLLFSGLVLAGCDSYNASWHQKMTVVVETSQGEVTGSSVVEIDFARGNETLMKNTAGSGVKWDLRGEAVVVELGDGHTLFALLKGVNHTGNAGINASFVFADLRGLAAGGAKAIDKVLAHRGATAKTISYRHMPLLVTFSDINDPSSVKKVEPNDLAAHFGAGVRLKRITLEITREPVTKGKVEKVLSFMSWNKIQWRNVANGDNPMRYTLDDGRIRSITKSAFRSRN